ncbi:MAG: DUF177 domain-containing protein [Rhodobacteraceae bacterium]|nr:DUF177 domain-containing protein [Paracoccaceae bacterium]
MRNALPFHHILRPGDLPAGQVHEFRLDPDEPARKAIAAALGLRGLRKLRLHGHLIPVGRADWQLKAGLGATAVQDCVVSMAPVVTRIDEPVARAYMAELPELPESDEIEIPDDDSAEPLAVELDLGAVMIEALALALPAYPHAEGIAPVERSFSPPGAEPLDDDAVRPFAGLARLKARLAGDDEN